MLLVPSWLAVSDRAFRHAAWLPAAVRAHASSVCRLWRDVLYSSTPKGAPTVRWSCDSREVDLKKATLDGVHLSDWRVRVVTFD